MSNFLAIATVTATLSQLLQSSVGVDVPGAQVTFLQPNGAEGGTPEPKVNLYAYQVTPNAALRNADLPTRRSDGTLVQRPQVALDVHYLLSFYGDEEQLQPQCLLGSVIRTLHTRPVLTRSMIQDTLKNPKFNFLAASNLADEIELVRFTPMNLNLEELSKLWSVFFQVRYALSIAYQASVVLIESEQSPQKALPVRDRNIYLNVPPNTH
jgi:Pvc16 N-terminal domain